MAASPNLQGLVMPAPSTSLPSVREIVSTHAAFVGRTLRYLGVREPDLEDATQEVFLVVVRKIDEFEGRSSLRTWLYGICVRVGLATRRRSASRREEVMAEPPEVGVAAAQDAEMGQREGRARLQRILDQLDDEKRAVFVLYEVERVPMKQVAEAIGCPLQTAYYRHQAARKIVLEAFEQQGQEDA